MPAPGFTMIPNEIIFSPISPQAKALFAVLSSFASDDSAVVWPSRRKLAQAMGMSQTKSVDKYVEELEVAGFLRRTLRPNKSTLYQVSRWVSGEETCRLSNQGGTPQGTRGSTPQRTTLSPTGDLKWYPTGDTNNTHRTILKEQDPSLTTSSVNFCSGDGDAPRRGGQLPAEETRKPIWEEQKQIVGDSGLSAENGKDAGKRIELGPLMDIMPDWLSAEQSAALKAKGFGWSPDARRWVVLPFT